MKKQWLTVTTTHDLGDGLTREDRHVHPPEKGEQHARMVRRMREAGREVAHGPSWIEYTTRHAGTAHHRLEWTDAKPTGGAA